MKETKTKKRILSSENLKDEENLMKKVKYKWIPLVDKVVEV